MSPFSPQDLHTSSPKKHHLARLDWDNTSTRQLLSRSARTTLATTAQCVQGLGDREDVLLALVTHLALLVLVLLACLCLPLGLARGLARGHSY